jgi:hypothetical protein
MHKEVKKVLSYTKKQRFKCNKKGQQIYNFSILLEKQTKMSGYAFWQDELRYLHHYHPVPFLLLYCLVKPYVLDEKCVRKQKTGNLCQKKSSGLSSKNT